MSLQEIATALDRLEAVLRRRPEVGIHDDEPATAHWTGGAQVTTSHANGVRLMTDLPAELGGHGEHVTPAWLMRAGLASCAATRIVMAAASEGIALASLDVLASSRSDTCGLLGLRDVEGAEVPAGMRDVSLRVRIAAPGVAPARLHALVQQSARCSPVSDALQSAVPMAVSVEIDGEGVTRAEHA